MRHGLKTAHHTVSVQVDHLSIQREGQAYPAPQQVSLELHPGEVTLLLGALRGRASRRSHSLSTG